MVGIWRKLGGVRVSVIISRDNVMWERGNRMNAHRIDAFIQTRGL